MTKQVLVAYATKYGATAGIAERIGQVLRDAGLHAEVLLADRVREVSQYGAVVLGSAVYMFKWRKEAAKFLKANEKALAERPLWVFSSGPTGDGPLEAFMGNTPLPKAAQAIADRVQLREAVIFRGAADASKLGALDRWMLSKAKAALGDFRDWDAIEAWAKGIAEALK